MTFRLDASLSHGGPQDSRVTGWFTRDDLRIRIVGLNRPLSRLHHVGIQNGQDGANSQNGVNGEVTNADLASPMSSAISGTSNNTNGVSTLDSPFTNDPPTLADMELMRSKVNELILALRR